jgi:hypothetical protein
MASGVNLWPLRMLFDGHVDFKNHRYPGECLGHVECSDRTGRWPMHVRVGRAAEK